VWDNLLDQIQAKGWAWVAIGPDDGAMSNEPFPPYCYTVGLVHKGLPDLIIIGLDPRTAFAVGDQLILKALAEIDAEKAGPPTPGSAPFKLDTDLFEVFRGTRAMLVDVPTEQAAKRSLFALDYADVAGKPLQVIQLLWPDRQGRLPFEPGVSPSFAEAQPVLKYASPPSPNQLESPTLLQ
jgi:hypothetical protein